MSGSAKRLLLLLPIGLLSLGCQRSLNGSLATGPFAPAGTATQVSNSPLIPLGPISGATRVPPPATGSSSSGSNYLGAPSASNFDAIQSTSLQAANSFSPPAGSFRSSLGGMNVIDMTAQAQPPTNYQPAAPADFLRPVDQTYVAAPLPQYRGVESIPAQPYAPATYPSAVQPAGGFARTDTWQTVQPAIGQGAVYPSTALTSPGPSTAPVVQTASPSLPWRSPTTAR